MIDICDGEADDMTGTFKTPETMTELDKKLAKAARECSADAVRRTFAAGRPITILVGNKIVRRWADGHEELVKELPQ